MICTILSSKALDKLNDYYLALDEPNEKGDVDDENMVFWRGYHDVEMPEDFLKFGGTELAPLSTTTDLDVALAYAFRGELEHATLFRFRIKHKQQRGSKISWLSGFPAENEYLQRPMTTLAPFKVSDNDDSSHSEAEAAVPYRFNLVGKNIVVLDVEVIRR